MPKNKENTEEYLGMEQSDLTDEDLEAMEKSSPQMKKSPMARLQKAAPKVVKKRYQAFVQSPRVGILDAETGEVVAEGETAILEALANMMERLERIELSIGVITNGE